MSSIHSLRPLAYSLGLTVVMGCSTSPPPGRVYVVDRPPPARAEIIPVRPGGAYVWVPGYWARRPAGYVWLAGHYEVPPARRRAYQAGRWRHGRTGWYYVDGHWR